MGGEEVKHAVITPDPFAGKRINIPLDKDLEEMLISAERYAVGRRTYIVDATAGYILLLLPHLSEWCISVMQHDMISELDLAKRMQSYKCFGDPSDYRTWMKFKEALDEEMKRRKG